MLDRLALDMQIGKRAGADGLGLEGEGLARLEPLRAPVEAVRTRQQLLPLLERGVGRVVAVSTAKERGPVFREGAQFAPVALDVRVPVTEPLVDLGASC